ncbi:MAG: efflux RND transporter periplasmic adaptor subunit [Planctomycetaceae bacterium]|nr:efflux RND transporter periplasmic adaptor subunit [Planctomycetaceae bacterium]
MHAATHSTYQLSEIVLKLRDDLNVSLRADRGEPTWLIEDERTGRYYRVGQREYTFLSLLDGRRTFVAVLGRTAGLLKDRALTAEEAGALCRWLVETGLATTTQSQSTLRVLQQVASTRRHKLLRGLLSPLSQTVPLLRPDRWFQTLASVFGWLLSGPMLIVYVALAIAGGFAVAADWERFRDLTPSVVSRDRWLWLGILWGVLKLIHETAHGFACRKFGGHVREAGVTFILFVPLPYVDVTSAWRFGSKWQRIVTSAAGMGAEVVIGSLAAILWSRTEPGWLNEQLHAVVLSATVVTLLFNANPLMRFDGYYILADLLGLPNLSKHGAQAWRQLGRRWVLGLRGEVPQWPEGRTWLVLFYGLAAVVWRVVICVGLILAADALWFGAGIILATLATILWGFVPLGRLLWFVLRGTTTEHPSRLRFASVVTLAAAGLWLVGRGVTWSPQIEAPAVVAFYPTTEIRSAVGGFVERLSIHEGDLVQAGQELLRLRNDELQADLADLNRQLEQTQLRGQVLLQQKELSAWEAEQERLAGLEKRRRQLEGRRSALIVRAPREGVVLDAEINSLVGQYIQAGEPLLSLGGTGDKQVLAMIEPGERTAFDESVGTSVDVRFDGRATDMRSGRIVSLASRAVHELPHAALGAHAGGELDVRAVQQSEHERDVAGNVELVTPRLLVRLALADDAMLRAGETGVIRLSSDERPIVRVLEEMLSNWWARRETALREQWYR